MMRLSAAFGRGILAPAALLAFAVSACGGSNDFSGPSDDGGSGFIDAGLITVDGERRAYIVSVPEGLEGTGAPLIIGLHGAFSAGDPFRTGTDLDRLGDSLGVVIVYPTSLAGNWAEDCGCIAADTAMVNDTLFMSLLIDTMVVNFGVDPGRVGVIGFSQGGMFAQRLACQLSDRVGRVAVVAATMSEPLAGRCNPARAVDMLMILGTADAQFPWDGRNGGLMSTLGAEEAMSLWASLNGCDPDPVDEDTDQLMGRSWTSCVAGGGSKLVGIRGGGHSFTPGGFPTLGELADFFGP